MAIAEERLSPGLEERCLSLVRLEREICCRVSELREAAAELAPVAFTGSLKGCVVDPWGIPVLARVIVRDRTHAIVGESYTARPGAGSVAGRFEVRGLPTGQYRVVIAATGFTPEIRYGVRVRPSTMTNLGHVHLTVASAPGITVQPLLDSVPAWLPLVADRNANQTERERGVSRRIPPPMV